MNAAHTLDDPEFAAKAALFRVVCKVIIGVTIVLTVGVMTIVTFALDGRPLAGHFYRLAGVSITTYVAAAICLASIPVATLVPKLGFEKGLARLAASHPEVIGTRVDGEKLLSLILGGIFTRIAILESPAVGCIVLLHFTADPLLLGCIALCLIAQLSHYPASGRLRRVFDESLVRLAELRDARRTS